MLEAGTLFERYEILSLLGAGGMGEVYRAQDTHLARTVALKVLRPGVDRKRLFREAQATAALQHPNAVAIYDVGEENGVPFLMMELLRGKTLTAYFGDSAVPVRQKITWLVQVGRALAAAHEVSVVHRDIKPENIFITSSATAKVLDFGLARAFSGESSGEGRNAHAHLGTLTAAHPRGMGPGTPLYMAPEQFMDRPLDGRSDQFALALVAYELLSGSLPWDPDGNVASLLAQVLMAPAPPLSARAPGAPASMTAAVMRALTKDPAGRFARMDDFVAAMERALVEDDPYGQTLLPEAAGDLHAQSSPRGSSPPVSPRVGAATEVTAIDFLGAFSRALQAAVLPDDATGGEWEAFVAHRVFDFADGARLRCCAKECKAPGRVGPLAGRKGIGKHRLKKDSFSFTLYKEWLDYSLPLAIVEHVVDTDAEQLFDKIWDVLFAFAPLRVVLTYAEDEASVRDLIERLQSLAALSGWRYPGGVDDIILIGHEGMDPMAWRVVRRSPGGPGWLDTGLLPASDAGPPSPLP
jgi:hypothetical protein